MKWQQHKLLKPPTPEQMARMEPEQLVELHTLYHEAIKNANDDPYRYGFRLPRWDYADKMIAEYRTLLLLGANRSGKTQYCARQIVTQSLANPDSLIYCFSQNKETSILVQQSAIYNALPKELKEKRFTKVANLNYSFKNGFTDNGFILENGTRVVFKFYTQWLQDDTILEGMELGSPFPEGVNIGAWCDEYLLGMDLLDRLRLRLATHDAKLLLSFTPKDGETETVKNFRNNATTIERVRVSEGLIKPQSVPVVEKNDRMDTGIIYFHSKDNPWSGYPSLLSQCIAKGDDNYTLTALYGVPTKSAATIFPKFQDVNVIEADKIPNHNVTRYMVIDPAGRKPWFMTWIAVDASDTWYVYREWPMGEWARERGGKWVAGEACREKLGYGVREYAELILELEQGEKMAQRLIDPRMGAHKYSAEHGGQSDYISDLEKNGMVVIPAPGIEEEPGLQAIQDKLAWNDKREMDAQNRPHLYISDQCQNTIKSLQEYDCTPRTEALKDPIDCLRYAAVHGLVHIDAKSLQTTRTGQGGY